MAQHFRTCNKKVCYVLINLDHILLNIKAITVIDTVYPGFLTAKFTGYKVLSNYKIRKFIFLN